MINEKKITFIYNTAIDKYRKTVFDRENHEESSNPIYTKEGKWQWGDTWSGGFLIGSLLLLYEYDGSSFWKNKALECCKGLNKYILDDSFQDIGYIIYFSYAIGYDITKISHLKENALKTAESLFNSLMPGGYLKCSWMSDGEKIQSVDGLMNNLIWIWAYKQTKDKKYIKAFQKNITISINNLIKSDGGTYEYVQADPLSGDLIKPIYKNSESIDSVWTRGHTWAIYGLIKAEICLSSQGYKQYLEEIDKLSEFFIENCQNYLPSWDLVASKKKHLLDTSAAAIAASAFLEYGHHLSINNDLINGGKYWGYGERILIQLCNNFISYDHLHQGLLLDVSTPFKYINAPNESAIWGDYFLLEALSVYRRYSQQ